MTIPVYDTTTLPRITLPMKNKQKASKRYLGGVAITQAVYIDVNITALTHTEEKALKAFWDNDLKGGVEPFLVALPIFGEDISVEMPSLLVQFVGDKEDDYSGNLWKVKARLKVYGTIAYTVDNEGNFIVTDAGEFIVTAGGDYVPTGNIITSYREVLYGSN